MKFFLSLVLYAVCAIAAMVGIPYILPLAGPFLIAFAAAAAMEPAVSALHRRGVSRALAAGVITVLLLIVLGLILSLTASKVFSTMTAFAGKTPELLEMLSASLNALQEKALLLIRSAPEGLIEELSIAMEALTNELYAVPAWLSEKLLAFLAGLARRSPDLLLFTATSAIGIYFFSASYRDIMDFIQRQLPHRVLHKARRAWASLRSACAGYLRVQAILLGITFAELWLLFLILKLKNTLLLAGIIALVDALPVLGAGTVLLPWALYCLIMGNSAQAIGLLTGYAIITAVRNLIQAKLVGDQLGLHPVVSLICIYVGWKLAGFAGMIILPIAAVVLQQLNDIGVVRLWK